MSATLRSETGPVLEACAAQYGHVALTFDPATGWTLDLGRGRVVLRDHDLDAMMARALVGGR